MATQSLTDDALEFHPQYGASLCGRWVPSPRYLLRRDRVLRFLRTRPPAELIEIGCGSAALLFDLCRLGFRCQGVDSSSAALEVARQILKDVRGADVTDEPSPDWKERFDYLIACEVLEHIDDDAAALRSWLEWVKPGGYIILSVPAHMSMWSASDVWAGHFRRYDRVGLENLAQSSNLQVLRTECIGFPLANLTHRLRNMAIRKSEDQANAERASNTAKSGIDRSIAVRLFGFQTSHLGRLIMKTACLTQRLFMRTDLGDCYLLIGRKK